MGEQFIIRQMPEARTVISHVVSCTSNVGVTRVVAMVALVEGLES